MITTPSSVILKYVCSKYLTRFPFQQSPLVLFFRSQKHGILEWKGLERCVTQPLHFAEVETESRRGKIMERYTGQRQAGPRSSWVEPTEIFPCLRKSLELNGGQPLLLPEWKLTRARVLPGLLIAESAAPGLGLTQSKCSLHSS